MGEVTKTVRALETATVFADNGCSFAVRQELDVGIRQVGPVHRAGKRSPIPMAESAGVEDLHAFEIPGRSDEAAKVLSRRVHVENRRSRASISLYPRLRKRARAIREQERWIGLRQSE